jgi:hypothetical protein
MMQRMALRLLSERDIEAFCENGYLVVPNVVPQEKLDAVVAAVWEFLEMDPEDRLTWYPPDRKGSLAHLHQHQALWDCRQHPRVHEAFTDILGTEALWVSMDRATMKPPIDARFPHYDDRGFVHWDLDTSKPLPEQLGVQGVLALADTSAEMGGFQCIPGFHRVLADWIREQPEDRNPRAPDLSRLPEGYHVTPIPMKAGDLVIWNRMLAHGKGETSGRVPVLPSISRCIRRAATRSGGRSGSTAGASATRRASGSATSPRNTAAASASPRPRSSPHSDGSCSASTPGREDHARAWWDASGAS